MSRKLEQVVFVIDDEPSVRRSVRLILASANHQVAEFESAADFLEQLAVGNPADFRGCIVSDVRMPKLDGLKFLQRLRELRIRLPVLMLTGHADVPMAVTAMKLGAFEFLEKPVDPDALRSKVAAALALEAANHEAVLETLEIESKYATLSAREAEVLELLVAGKPPKLIASLLGTAQSTVRIQRQSICSKMQADNVSDLIRMMGKIGRLDE